MHRKGRCAPASAALHTCATACSSCGSAASAPMPCASASSISTAASAVLKSPPPCPGALETRSGAVPGDAGMTRTAASPTALALARARGSWLPRFQDSSPGSRRLALGSDPNLNTACTPPARPQPAWTVPGGSLVWGSALGFVQMLSSSAGVSRTPQPGSRKPACASATWTCRRLPLRRSDVRNSADSRAPAPPEGRARSRAWSSVR